MTRYNILNFFTKPSLLGDDKEEKEFNIIEYLQFVFKMNKELLIQEKDQLDRLAYEMKTRSFQYSSLSRDFVIIINSVVMLRKDQAIKGQLSEVCLMNFKDACNQFKDFHDQGLDASNFYLKQLGSEAYLIYQGGNVVFFMKNTDYKQFLKNNIFDNFLGFDKDTFCRARDFIAKQEVLKVIKSS